MERPRFLASLSKTASAIGLRQIFPRHTKRTATSFDEEEGMVGFGRKGEIEGAQSLSFGDHRHLRSARVIVFIFTTSEMMICRSRVGSETSLVNFLSGSAAFDQASKLIDFVQPSSWSFRLLSTTILHDIFSREDTFRINRE